MFDHLIGLVLLTIVSYVFCRIKSSYYDWHQAGLYVWVDTWVLIWTAYLLFQMAELAKAYPS